MTKLQHSIGLLPQIPTCIRVQQPHFSSITFSIANARHPACTCLFVMAPGALHKRRPLTTMLFSSSNPNRRKRRKSHRPYQANRPPSPSQPTPCLPSDAFKSFPSKTDLSDPTMTLPVLRNPLDRRHLIHHHLHHQVHPPPPPLSNEPLSEVGPLTYQHRLTLLTLPHPQVHLAATSTAAISSRACSQTRFDNRRTTVTARARTDGSGYRHCRKA